MQNLRVRTLCWLGVTESTTGKEPVTISEIVPSASALRICRPSLPGKCVMKHGYLVGCSAWVLLPVLDVRTYAYVS